jgi:hypothetical protein
MLTAASPGCWSTPAWAVVKPRRGSSRRFRRRNGAG